MHMGTLAILRAQALRSPDSPWLRWYLRLPIPPSSYFVMIVAYLLSNSFNARYAINYLGDAELASGLDRLIPFLPWTLLAYIANFAFYLLPRPLLAGNLQDRQAYRAINQALLGITFLSCAIFLLFPSSVEMRAGLLAQLDPGDYPGWLLNACSALFKVDHSFNAWPSLHVSQPLLILLATHYWGLFDIRQRRVNWMCFAIVAGSVLTLKQHYLWDVASGAALALAVWMLFLRDRLSLVNRRAVIGTVLGGAS
jgi:hypothetical protein